MIEIVDLIKRIYANLMKKNLPIFGIPTKDLNSYTTREKDAYLEICRMPLRQFRMRDERVLEDLDSSDDDEEGKELDDGFVILDRDEAKKIDMYLKKLNDPSMLSEESKRIHEGKSVLVFSKRAKDQDSDIGHPSSLEDFDILKVIDKGSFGKVFLVKSKLNDKLYAMKRIRKDILIEKGQIQNTHNEKEILLNIEHPFLLGMDYVFTNDLRIYFFLDYVK